jgi:exodeoxyribonuclease VII large subunit
MPRDPERSLSVAAVNRLIQGAFDGLGPLVVHGELSQCRVHGSGHCYATLKERDEVLNLVLWRSTMVRIGKLPAEGSLVEVRGSLSLYGPRGSFQLVATRISPLGAGDLAARFEALRQRLQEEGLFDEARKRPLPWLPRAVGLATAAGSAALADLREGLERRFPDMPLVLAPCQVQGRGASASVAAALARLAAHPEVEVIILARGGGSLEDLWAFNEEATVRAIAACPKPVISAIGHESDTTLADLVADLRAKTPTAAAELVVPEQVVLQQQLAAFASGLEQGISRRLAIEQRRWQALADHRALAQPQQQVHLRQQRCDELASLLGAALRQHLRSGRDHLCGLAESLRLLDPARRLIEEEQRCRRYQQTLARALAGQLERQQQRLAATAAHLDALSPLRVIARGYSVLLDEQGQALRRCDQAPPGSRLRARLSDGWLNARIEGHEALG